MAIKNKIQSLSKLFMSFFFYFIISFYGGLILKAIGINSKILILFIKDIIFLVFIFWLYFDALKEDFKEFKKQGLLKNIKSIILWLLFVYIISFLLTLIMDYVLPLSKNSFDSNYLAQKELFALSKSYTIFKILIFSTIAEQILFKESIREVIDNKWLYVIISSLIITIIPFAFESDLANILLNVNIVDTLLTFAISVLFNLAFIQNKSNIIFIMIIYFIYNIMPTILLAFNI